MAGKHNYNAMATFKIYKLHFNTPLHIGDKRDDEGVSLKTIQSDTLMAAITSALAKVGNKIPDNGDLGCVVSSLFPYYQGEKDTSSATYFLPMPLSSRPPVLADVSKAKMVKRIRWIDAQLYGKVLAGENLFDGSVEHFDHIHGEFLTTSVLPDKFIRSEVCQRVKLESRVGETDALPYYVDRITFEHRSGLYFIVKGDTTLLDKGLHILMQEGIGTDRSIGYGFFEVQTDELKLNTPLEAKYVVSLSLLIPADKNQLNGLFSGEEIAYDFLRRGGWITTQPYQQLRKNAIYGFLPGSVFSKQENDVCGTIVDLAPAIVKASSEAHPIWRDGRSILLPIKR